jgi:cytidine deaminase
MGAIIIGLTIIKGLNIENISNYQGTHNEKPKLID